MYRAKENLTVLRTDKLMAIVNTRPIPSMRNNISEKMLISDPEAIDFKITRAHLIIFPPLYP